MNKIKFYVRQGGNEMNREIMLLCTKLDRLCREYSDTSFRLSLARAKKDSVFTSVYEDKLRAINAEINMVQARLKGAFEEVEES